LKLINNEERREKGHLYKKTKREDIQWLIYFHYRERERERERERAGKENILGRKEGRADKNEREADLKQK
jgi:hypothetical protein